MKHFLYVMHGSDPAPAGDGDTASWFDYYKWNVDEETYVPKSAPYLAIQDGDFLWFVLDAQVVGGAKVLRVETPSLPTQKQEIWYDPCQAFKLGWYVSQAFKLGWYVGWRMRMGHVLTDKTAKIWMMSARRRQIGT